MKKILVIGFIGLLLLGCSGNKKHHHKRPPKPRRVLSIDIPVWFYDIPQHSSTGIGIGINEDSARINAAKQVALFEESHIVCKFCEYDNERDKLGLRLQRMEVKYTEINDELRHDYLKENLNHIDGVNIKGDYIGLFSVNEIEAPFGNKTVSENDVPEWYDEGKELQVEGQNVLGFGMGRSHTISRAFEKAYNDALLKFSRYISTKVESYVESKLKEDTDWVYNAQAIESDIILKNVKLVKLFVIPSADAVGLQQYKVFCQIRWNKQQEIIDLK